MSEIGGVVSLERGIAARVKRVNAEPQSTSNCIRKERVIRPQRIKELSVISKR